MSSSVEIISKCSHRCTVGKVVSLDREKTNVIQCNDKIIYFNDCACQVFIGAATCRYKSSLECADNASFGHLRRKLAFLAVLPSLEV